ncbi:putative L-serine dehydratase [Aspergillus saccharolyticus JOP 1030-1]|uniref:L-serine ammonia-lyase n=1 Tax=Aspergillus saccharolyticus JOP 1030-1 TaxID=1450539 RepID=A0A318ZIM2_9EURO|nr:tryptophan synthase beta subunit-like PLP-dependent enzyme [Aspergillus saccharolyticus JOP 1030-1]PYH47416.1 tryptophan synthase beta subunit-like PLP-dependent enzyme [Aspergillus saccharolyticus JOP 1030-1]
MGSISLSQVDDTITTGSPTFKNPWNPTPLVESTTLSRAAGCRIFLKLENLQPSGSFKSRAMGNQILSHLRKPENAHRPVHFYASSGGNAGLAAVCAARTLGYPCTVVVPMSTKPLMVTKLRRAGAADVIQHGETFSEAGQYMKDVVMQQSKTSSSLSTAAGTAEAEDVVKIALHPFDNEPIWEGNSTIVDELVQQMPRPEGPAEVAVHAGRALPVDAIVCSVGGGGLLNGLVIGVERARAAKKLSGSSEDLVKPVHLLAVETKGTDSLASALQHEELVSLPKITSQATSLGAIRVSERTFQYAVKPPPGVQVHSTVLSDAEAARGVLRLADEERSLVELACGVCVEAVVGSTPSSSTGKKRKYVDEGYGDDRLSAGENDEEGFSPVQSPVPSTPAASLSSKLKQLVPDLNEDSRVVIIVCGGSNVTIDMAAEWRKLLAEGWA